MSFSLRPTPAVTHYTICHTGTPFGPFKDCYWEGWKKLLALWWKIWLLQLACKWLQVTVQQAFALTKECSIFTEWMECVLISVDMVLYLMEDVSITLHVASRHFWLRWWHSIITTLPTSPLWRASYLLWHWSMTFGWTNVQWIWLWALWTSTVLQLTHLALRPMQKTLLLLPKFTQVWSVSSAEAVARMHLQIGTESFTLQ